jgi:hypothetical protein
MSILSNKKTLGRSEVIDFPDLGLIGIEAKIDTGAWSSAVHCFNIKALEPDHLVSFQVLDPSHPAYAEETHIYKISAIRPVKSSSGDIENRYFIKTQVVIFGQVMPIEISLTNRSSMGFPVLIGRKILKGNFVVDVAKKNCSLKLLSKTTQ